MINDYQELVTEAAQRSGVSDLPSRAAMIVGMAEGWLNKRLRTADQQTATTLTTDANGDASLPSDYEAMQVVYFGTRKLERRPLENILLGDSDGYVIQGATFKSTLTSTAHSVVYYASLPALASNTTNWLLTAEPELYLNTVIFQAYASKPSDPEMIQRAATLAPYIEGLVDDVNNRDWSNRWADTTLRMGGTVV